MTPEGFESDGWYRVLFDALTREQWAALGDDARSPLAGAEISRLGTLDDVIDVAEVTDVYLPLTRLLDMHRESVATLRRRTGRMWAGDRAPSPFVIGIAGSVAVGKSTTARLLQALLAEGGDTEVALVTTDGFLYPNRELTRRGLMQRKGFPESYDVRRLIGFLADVKRALPGVAAPVYSHLSYDIVEGAEQVVGRPEVVIVEGLNVLQTPPGPSVMVSDFFDFSIYVHADEHHLRDWYVQRFLSLARTTFLEPDSYFHRHAKLPVDEAIEVADGLWAKINAPNLVSNILPTRPRADLVLEKGADHRVERVLLRRR